LTAVGVDASTELVVLVLSLSCTTPATLVLADATLIAGVVVPFATEMAPLPVTLVTVPR